MKKLFNVPINKSITLNDFIQNGEANKITTCPTYIYDARECNCQKYVKQMVSGSFTWTKQMDDFTIQNVSHSVPSLLWQISEESDQYGSSYSIYG